MADDGVLFSSVAWRSMNASGPALASAMHLPSLVGKNKLSLHDEGGVLFT